MPAFAADDPSQLHLELEALPVGTPSSEVARQLIALLTDGTLQPGSRLPPERVLQAELGVGRSAVREALAALEILGVVTVRPGSGTYLRDSGSELLPTTLSWGLMLSSSSGEELIQLRAVLEVWTAATAAERAAEDDIERLRGYVATMSRRLDEPDAFIEADMLFHSQLAASAGNAVIKNLLQTIRSLLRIWVERRLRTREQAEDAVVEHRAVLNAIARRDADAAAAAMSEHMVTAGRRLSEYDH